MTIICFTGSVSDAEMAPPAYIAKYNRFVDNILERINKILRRSYDPVNVRLQTVPETKQNSKKKHKKRKNKNNATTIHKRTSGSVLRYYYTLFE